MILINFPSIQNYNTSEILKLTSIIIQNNSLILTLSFKISFTSPIPYNISIFPNDELKFEENNSEII